MKNHNPANERIKRKYFAFLKEAKRHSEPTVDAAAKALSRFEAYTKYRDFKAFHFEQTVAFKRHLAEQKGQKSGEKLSKAALHSTFTQLKRFFQWLKLQPGYKIRFQYTDADYFNLSDRVLTTFLSYGEVACQRQGEIIRRLSAPRQTTQPDADKIADALFKRLHRFDLVKYCR